MQTLRQRPDPRVLIVAGAFVAMMTACAPIGLAELRREPPAQIVTYTKPAAELTACTLITLRNEAPAMWGRSLGNLAWEMTKPTDDITHISGRTPQHAFPMVDIQFERTKNGATVEIRRGGFEPRSNDSFFVEEVRKRIDHCAA